MARAAAAMGIPTWVAGMVRAIPRVVNPSFAEFRAQFLSTSTPVIVSGATVSVDVAAGAHPRCRRRMIQLLHDTVVA